jgi:hypothetical protein
VWIPDESFFQTLIRNVAPAARISNRCLTHYAFDMRGRPREYGDADRDYLCGLSTAGQFFARKISPNAEQLREYFLRVATDAPLPDHAGGQQAASARL